MNKIILTIFIFLNLLSIAKADVIPYYINSLKRYGIGYTSVSSPLVMRRTPDSNGEILETLEFDFKGNVACQKNTDRCDINEIFSAYSESKNIALLTTLDETQDWNMVCFNQINSPVCGWVETSKNRYYGWAEFFNIYGKKYGIYLFKDLQKKDKLLYASPIKETNTTGSIELAKSVIPWLVRGNWILVKVIDFDNQAKTGWINFRGDDNKLKLFVKF